MGREVSQSGAYLGGETLGFAEGGKLFCSHGHSIALV